MKYLMYLVALGLAIAAWYCGYHFLTTAGDRLLTTPEKHWLGFTAVFGLGVKIILRLIKQLEKTGDL